MSTVEDIIFCLPWRISSFVNLSTLGDIIIHVGDIMSTLGGVQYHGSTQKEKIYPPTVLNNPSTVLMISPKVLSTPNGTEHTFYRVIIKPSLLFWGLRRHQILVCKESKTNLIILIIIRSHKLIIFLEKKSINDQSCREKACLRLVSA